MRLPLAGRVESCANGLNSRVPNLLRCLTAAAVLLLANGCAISGGGAEQGIDRVWLVDADQRRPNSPSGFSLPVADAERVYIGGQDGYLRIFGRDGGERRRIALDAPCESGVLLLENGLLVIGDVNGMLYGVDTGRGEIVWRQQLSSLLLGNPVIVAGGFLLQTSDNRVYRFTSDGKKLWSYAGSLSGLSLHMAPSPLIVGNTVYTVFSNGDVVALSLKGGELLWKRQLLLDPYASVLSELQVPVADPVLVRSFSSRNLVSSTSNSVVDLLLIGFYQGELIGLSPEDGSKLYARAASLKSAPLLHDGVLYLADSEGAVTAIAVQNEQTLWKKKLSDTELIGPVLWNRQLWIADDAGTLYRLDTEGRETGRTRLEGRVNRTPVVSKFGVLVRTDLGRLYLLN